MKTIHLIFLSGYLFVGLVYTIANIVIDYRNLKADGYVYHTSALERLANIIIWPIFILIDIIV